MITTDLTDRKAQRMSEERTVLDYETIDLETSRDFAASAAIDDLDVTNWHLFEAGAMAQEMPWLARSLARRRVRLTPSNRTTPPAN